MGKQARIIIGAMEQELQGIRADDIARATGLNEVVGLRSGVGKVNAAIRIMEFFTQRRYSPEWHPHVLIVGTAGALAPTLAVGDAIIASDTVQHDVDASPVGFPRGTIPFEEESAWRADPILRDAAERAARGLGYPVTVGRVCSGDRFIADSAERSWLHEHLQGACVDMETAAIACACARLGIPWVGIRIISDRADCSAGVDFSIALALAAQRIAEIIPHITAATIASP